MQRDCVYIKIHVSSEDSSCTTNPPSHPLPVSTQAHLRCTCIHTHACGTHAKGRAIWVPVHVQHFAGWLSLQVSRYRGFQVG